MERRTKLLIPFVVYIILVVVVARSPELACRELVESVEAHEQNQLIQNFLKLRDKIWQGR